MNKKDITFYKVPESQINADEFKKITNFNGIFYINNLGTNYFICEPKVNDHYDVIKNPSIWTFEETMLRDANVLKRATCGSRYELGRYYLSNGHKAQNGLNPCLSKFNTFLINHSENLEKFKKNIDMNIMFYDIETTGLSPVYSTLLSIGKAHNHEEVQMLDIRQYLTEKEMKAIKNPLTNELALEAERYMLIEFFKSFDTNNVDLFVGYNSWKFDNPFIIYRALRHRLYENIQSMYRFAFPFLSDYSNPLGGEVSENYHKRLEFLSNHLKDSSSAHDFDFGGRLHLDIMKLFTERDVTLQHKKMKYAGRKYKLDKIHEIFDEINVKSMWEMYADKYDLAQKYLTSDIHLTRNLFLLYFPRVTSFLNDENYTLSGIIHSQKTSTLSYTCGKALYEKDFIIGPNSPNVSPIKLSLPNKYEGAITGKQSVGWFEKTYKRDVTSYYPNLIMSLNLGITNTVISKIRPYTGQYEFHYDENKNYHTMVIPDINNKIDVFLRIYKESCPFVNVTDQKFIGRKATKRAYQKAYDEGDHVTASILYGKEQSEKVFINSGYGALGNEDGLGNIASAIGVVGGARYFISLLLHAINMLTPKDEDSIISEIDTDGIIFTKNVNIDDINEYMKDMVESTGIATRATIALEEEDKGRSFILKIKTYYNRELKDVEGKAKIEGKGSSIKSKNNSPFMENIVMPLFKKHQFSDDPTEIKSKNEMDNIIKEIIHNPNKIGFDQYVKTVSNSKSLKDYDASNHVRKLGEQWEEYHKEKIKMNTTMEYLSIIEPPKFLLYTPENIELIKQGTYTLNFAKYYQEYLNTVTVN